MRIFDCTVKNAGTTFATFHFDGHERTIHDVWGVSSLTDPTSVIKHLHELAGTTLEVVELNVHQELQVYTLIPKE